GAAAIQRATGARVYAHVDDAGTVEAGEIRGRARHRSAGVANWLIYQLFIKRTSPRFAPVVVDERLRDGDVLPLGGGLEVIHTPGHSAGHVALLLHRESVLIAGDLCATFAGLGYSTVYEDREQGRQSILRAAGFPFDTAVFGHGKPLKGKASERLRAKFA
ncbi:MAG: MBL fold metallo-hydrolase, partial [Hymenobacteraceae bacterium]|nr:MBL fold metallo-hydrolase [Hymenobacteraceae bacterium]